MRNVIAILTILLVLLTGAVFVSAQKDKKNQKAPLTIRVNLDVKDAAGNRITDLTKERVKIFENGEEQPVTYFKQNGPVLNLGLVMDNTGSMRPQLNVMTRAGNSFVELLSGAGEVFVLRFVSSRNIEVIQDWTNNKAALDDALENMFVEGGQSAIIDAVKISAEKLRAREKADSSRKYVLVVMSDMEDRDSANKLEDLRAVFEGSDAQVFLIGLMADLQKESYPRSEHLAHNIAIESGGRAFFLRKKYKPEELADILKTISDEIRFPYTVGYTPSNQNRNGKERKITIQIADGANGEKRTATARETVTVPTEKPPVQVIRIQ